MSNSPQTPKNSDSISRLTFGFPDSSSSGQSLSRFNNKTSPLPLNAPSHKTSPQVLRPTHSSKSVGTNVKMLENNSQTMANETEELLARIKTQISNVKSDVRTRGTTNQSNITGMKDQIGLIVNKLRGIEDTSTNNDKELREAMLAKEALLREKQESHKHINELQKNISVQDGRIVDMEDKKKRSENEYEQKINELKSQLNEIQSQLQQKNSEITNLKSSKGSDTQAINSQISQLEQIQNQLNALDTQVDSQGKSIDGSFDQFNQQISTTNDVMNNIDSAVKSVGTMIGSIFTFGGGKKKKRTPSIKYHKRSRTTLNKIAKKWGISDTKKYKSKSQLLAALTLIVVYKVKSKVYNKKDLMVIAKNLDIKYDKKVLKNELQVKIDKKTRKFSIKDLY